MRCAVSCSRRTSTPSWAPGALDNAAGVAVFCCSLITGRLRWTGWSGAGALNGEDYYAAWRISLEHNAGKLEDIL
jgi:hypothetical protein